MSTDYDTQDTESEAIRELILITAEQLEAGESPDTLIAEWVDAGYSHEDARGTVAWTSAFRRVILDGSYQAIVNEVYYRLAAGEPAARVVDMVTEAGIDREFAAALVEGTVYADEGPRERHEQWDWRSYRHFAFEGSLESFPLLAGVNEYAEAYGGCRSERWGDVLAHAHHEIGWICVRGPANPKLWDDGGRPTSLFLHEYAHLQVAGGHTDTFWAANRELHKQYKVTHARFTDALGQVIGGLVVAALGLGLMVVTGFGFFAFGAIIGVVMGVAALVNSFGTEQRETEERECGTRTGEEAP